MGWNDEELQNETKKGMSSSSKVLLAIIGCIILIIILLAVVLMNSTNKIVFRIYVNGNVDNTVKSETLLTTVGDATYINIEEFAKIMGYEYHDGEYKSIKGEKDKCHVVGVKETASFYLNDNRVYKLPVNRRDLQYNEYEFDNPVTNINDKMYASIQAVAKAFNVLLELKDTGLEISTLDYLIPFYDTKVIEWGYTGIAEQSLDNQKALLEGLLIVQKDGGLYKIIDYTNTKEVALARYISIEFSEYTREFFVTDGSGKVGIINLDGTIKIDPIYSSIAVLDKEANLYIVGQNNKYGVISGAGDTVIYPEYDSIGMNDNSLTNNRFLLLNELIPVYKDKKWGAFNKNGKMIFNVEYDELGYSSTSIEINGIKEVVQPVLVIERANGVVVRKENQYGLLDMTGKELVRITVKGIYAREEENKEKKYFMLYNGEEMNVIERLIAAGKIEENPDNEENNDTTDDTTNETVNDNQTVIQNTITNDIENSGNDTNN